MKRFFRILLGLLGVVVLLVLITAVALPLIYDTEDLKRLLAREAEARTGRELTIAGNLDFSVFPWLAVEVEDLSLGNAEGFGEQPMAKIGSARLGVALMPLFNKRVSIDQVTLDGLVLELAVDAQGRGNWEDLVRTSDDPATGEPGNSLLQGQRVAGVSLRNAQVSLRDAAAGGHYRLDGLDLTTGALGEGLPVPVDLSARVEDVVASVSWDLSLSATAQADLDSQRFTFESLQLMLTPTAPDGAPGAAIEAPKAELDLAGQTLDLPEFSLAWADLRAAGSLSATEVVDRPSFRAALRSEPFSPADLLRATGTDAPAMTDPEALRHARFDAEIQGTADSVEVGALALELDQSRFVGELSVRNFARPAVEFTLNVDEIDLDRYMPSAGDGETAQGGSAVPGRELRGQQLNGRLTAGKLRLAGLDFTAAQVGLALRDGKLRVHPVTAEFYGGRVDGELRLDGSGEVPKLSLEQVIDGVTFQRLVADLVDTEALSGMAMGTLRLSGSGADSDALLRSLGGDLGVTLTEGALEGVNVWYEIRRAMAMYKGLAAPDPEPARTVFTRLQLAATVEDGVLRTRELVGDLPYLTLRGNGSADLAESWLDLAMVAEVRNVPEIAQDPLAAELSGRSLPFRITGPLDSPALAVDIEALLKSEAAGMLLDKLLGTGEEEAGQSGGEGQERAGQRESTDGGSSAEPEEDPEDALKRAAAGALLQILGGQSSEEEEEDDGSG